MRHDDLWRALDVLAAEHGLTPSGLARAAGLDATAFNPSKRVGPDGRPRWPSTESVSLALSATGASIASFVELMEGARALGFRGRRRTDIADAEHDGLWIAPLRGAEILAGFDPAGAPFGTGWEVRTVAPLPPDPGLYGLHVETDLLAPALRSGDLLVVSPSAVIAAGDRIVLGGDGAGRIARLISAAPDRIALETLLGDAAGDAARHDVGWMHRIVSVIH